MQTCSICLNEIDTPVYPKYCECNVPFHYLCLEKCYETNKRCPICRKNVRPIRPIRQISPHYNNHWFFILLENLILNSMDYLVHSRFAGLFIAIVFITLFGLWFFIGFPISIIMFIITTTVGIINGFGRVLITNWRYIR